MKIRTKLILLLSAAVIVTMFVSTWLRIDWTRRRLEEQLKQSAQDTAVLIANELSQRLHEGLDQDEITEALKDEQRRHPGGDLVLCFTDEDTVSSFALGQSMEEAKVDKKPRPVPKKSPKRSPMMSSNPAPKSKPAPPGAPCANAACPKRS